MLRNIPTHDGMEQVSLRLYFSALDHVVEILSEIQHIDEQNKEEDGPPNYYTAH
jgi:hypothetical protein